MFSLINFVMISFFMVIFSDCAEETNDSIQVFIHPPEVANETVFNDTLDDWGGLVLLFHDSYKF